MSIFAVSALLLAAPGIYGGWPSSPVNVRRNSAFGWPAVRGPGTSLASRTAPTCSACHRTTRRRLPLCPSCSGSLVWSRVSFPHDAPRAFLRRRPSSSDEHYQMPLPNTTDMPLNPLRLTVSPNQSVRFHRPFATPIVCAPVARSPKALLRANSLMAASSLKQSRSSQPRSDHERRKQVVRRCCESERLSHGQTRLRAMNDVYAPSI